MLAAIALCLSAGALPARHAPPARLIAAHRACGRAGRPALAAPNGRVTRVESVMTRDVVSLTKEQSLVDAMEIFVRRRISGAPVVDDNGQLCGILSQFDFLMKEAGTLMLDLESPNYERDVQKILGGRVRSAMTPSPTTVLGSATMQEAAAIMVRKRLNRLPVVDDAGVLTGILSSGDVMRHVLGMSGTG